MSSDSRINFDESIPDMIRRLEMEHKEFESQLTEVETNIEDNSIIRAAEIIKGFSNRIIHHAVEEEARLMRVIMHKGKEESAESINIIQEHNWVMNFLKNRLAVFESASVSSDLNECEQAKDGLNEFVNNLRIHFEEEKQVVFPLVLRLESARTAEKANSNDRITFNEGG
jgi:hemerythrin-like domain-containing protein